MTPYGPWVTLHRRVPAGKDMYGGAQFTVVNEPTRALAFDSGASTETPQGWVTSQPTVYLSLKTEASFLDAVTVGSVRYEIDGIPQTPVSPFTGWQPGRVVRLRLPTG